MGKKKVLIFMAQDNCPPDETAKNHRQKSLDSIHITPPSLFAKRITCKIARSGQNGIRIVSSSRFRVPRFGLKAILGVDSLYEIGIK
jgi:hypothetical protein